MEDYFDIHDQEEAEDALSLCDLPIHNDEPDCDEFSQGNPDPSSNQDLFEFFTNPNGSEMEPTKHIIFCGKLIPHEHEDHLTRANSLRFLTSKPSPSPATGSFRYSSTSSARSRKHVFRFGMEKFPPEMELSDMRKRQSRRTPAPLFPAVDGSKMVISGKGERGRGLWGLLRLLKCRTHFGRGLARASFSCMPLV